LEIEDADTGARLTSRAGGDDFFHSRLQVSSGGKYLLSAGWVWHPCCEARVFNLADALEDPVMLDGEGLFPFGPDEVESAIFSEPDKLVVATMRDDKEPAIGVWDLAANTWISRKSLDEPIGAIFASGDRGILRRAKSSRGGSTSRRDPSAALSTFGSTPQAAFDAANFRLAVATETGITVLAPPPCEVLQPGTI
jgi:hypothetical protein